jgi:thiamine biosynthesis lipoprotein
MAAPTTPRRQEVAVRFARPRTRAIAALLLLAASSILALAVPAVAAKREPRRGAPERESAERGGRLMGGVLVARLEAATATEAGRALDEALATIASVEAALDARRPEAELARVNASPAQTRIELSDVLGSAIAAALALARETDGAYDPTVGALTRAWNPEVRRGPDREALREALSQVGWPRVVLGPGGRSVWLQHEGMTLTLDGLDRGFALDRALDRMRARGVQRGHFDFGRVALAWSDERAVAATVPHPADRSRPAVGLSLKNGAAATAGPSSWPPPSGGPSCVFDPHRGAPVETAASVTVVCREATRADALASALLVLGRDAAGRWALEHPGDGVLWLEPDGPRVLAWRWNLTAAHDMPGAELRWMN